MKKFISHLTAFTGMAILASRVFAGSVGFSVSGRNILHDGVEFEVRGVCYQPTGIGENPSASYPYGDYYWMSSDYPARWSRDFANLRKMGVNVVRVYGWDPAQNHSAFLTQAYNGGTQSCFVLVNRWINPWANFADASAAPGYQPPTDVQGYIAEWQAIASEVATNPAVMGFLIGNEANPIAGTGFWDAMNAIAGAIKAIAPNKLVSIAITDRLDQVLAYNGTMTNFDFWAMQVYRGYSFGNFLNDYAAASGKPLVITEFGHDALDGTKDTEWPYNAGLPANAIEGLWNELRADAAGSGIASGGCVFEYADEWWKDTDSGDPFSHNYGPRWGGPFVDSQGNEEWWGIFRAVDNGGSIDILEPRALFYRLAAMWNDPFKTNVQARALGRNLEMSFSCPMHLKDQQLVLECSTNLSRWTPVADSQNSDRLSSNVSWLDITNTESGGNMQVKILYGPDVTNHAAVQPKNLVANGDFETGTVKGWITAGSITTTFAKDGGYSLRLTAPGGFAAPSAFQTLPASPGNEFRISGYMYTGTALPANASFGLFKIVFRDAIGTDLQPASISTGTRAAAPYPGAESVPVLNSSASPGTWLFSQAQAVAPAGTVSVSFFAIDVDETANILYFDTVQAVDVHEMPPSVPAGPTVFFRLANKGR